MSKQQSRDEMQPQHDADRQQGVGAATRDNQMSDRERPREVSHEGSAGSAGSVRGGSAGGAESTGMQRTGRQPSGARTSMTSRGQPSVLPAFMSNPGLMASAFMSNPFAFAQAMSQEMDRIFDAVGGESLEAGGASGSSARGMMTPRGAGSALQAGTQRGRGLGQCDWGAGQR